MKREAQIEKDSAHENQISFFNPGDTFTFIRRLRKPE